MKMTVKDIDVSGKRVLVRCDFNVPMNNGAITDDGRIAAVLPTIDYLIDQGAKVVLISHLGRPDGEPNLKYTLEPVAKRLSEFLGKEVAFESSPKVVDDKVIYHISQMRDRDISLLENLRFRKEEEENDPVFAKELASLADFFVNDAFGTAHRAHASTVGIAKYIPAVSGFLMEKEEEFLVDAVEHPKRPFLAIMGGAKVKDKIKVIENLLDKVDTLIIGGGMAFPFLKAMGFEVGLSLLEEEGIEIANELLEKSKAKKVEIFLPLDVVCSTEFSNDADHDIYDRDSIPKDRMGLDIGPKSIEAFKLEIAKAKTIFWNGPMGVFEMPNYAMGTLQVARGMAASKEVTIIGGGDSAAAVEQFGLTEKITHISTGGGASLELLEGKELPGISVLLDKEL